MTKNDTEFDFEKWVHTCSPNVPDAIFQWLKKDTTPKNLVKSAAVMYDNIEGAKFLAEYFFKGEKITPEIALKTYEILIAHKH